MCKGVLNQGVMSGGLCLSGHRDCMRSMKELQLQGHFVPRAQTPTGLVPGPHSPLILDPIDANTSLHLALSFPCSKYDLSP